MTTPGPCGCNAVVFLEVGRVVADVTLERCPLHAATPDLLAEAMNRKHYSDSPRSTLHSWNESELLQEIGGTCGLCAAIAKAKS